MIRHCRVRIACFVLECAINKVNYARMSRSRGFVKKGAMDSCISLKAGREGLNLVRGFEQNGGAMIFDVLPIEVAFISFIT